MVTPERLLEGLARTLERTVLPALAGGFARGQLYAVLEVLGALEGQVEWGGALLENERAMLEELIAAAGAQIGGELGQRLRDHGEPAARPLDQRLRQARGLVCELIEAGHADDGRPLADAIRAYLCNDAISKAMALPPGRLAEISQG